MINWSLYWELAGVVMSKRATDFAAHKTTNITGLCGYNACLYNQQDNANFKQLYREWNIESW